MKANNQFIKGQSGNPQGRPKGSGISAKLRQAIEGEAEAIIKTMIEQAKAGDMQAAKALLDKVLPTLKPEALSVLLPDMVGAETLSAKAEAAIDAAGAGELSPSAASDLVSAIAGLAKIIETTELQKRLEALELLLTPKKDEK
jgi:hypothetical protein